MSLGKKLKQIIKPTFGTNPNDQWSTKANISEASLNDYLLAKGINPKFVSKDTKISHAKSSDFAKWKQDHQMEEVQYVTEDALLIQYLKAKGINPTYVSKEQKIAYAKSGAFLKWKSQHMAEEVGLDEGRMKDIVTDREETSRLAAHERGGADAWYGRKYNNPHEKGSIEHTAYHQGYHGGEKGGKDYGTSKGKPQHSFRESSEPKATALDKFRAAAAERAKKHDTAEKEMKARHAAGKEDMKGAISRLEKSLNKEEVQHKIGDSVTVNSKFFGKQKGKVTKVDKQSVHVQRDGKESSEKYPHDAVVKEDIKQIDELKKTTVKSWLSKQEVVPAKKPGMDRKAFNKRVKTRSASWDRALDRMTGHKPTSESLYQDGAAATQTSFDGANAPDNTEPYQPGQNKKELSKSARIIKSIYKKLGMVKEELYDHEKEDKSVATYGKKPKMQELDDKRTNENRPQAAAVMSGGTTLTGQTRDTLEIDPEMKKPIKNK